MVFFGRHRFNFVVNLSRLRMVLVLVNLLISFDLINGVLNILKNWISSHNLWSSLLIFLSSQFSCVKFLCILSLLWFCWRIMRILFWKLLRLRLICFHFFQFFLFFPLLEFSLLFNREITVNTLQILVHLFTLCLVVLSLGRLWLYPNTGFLWNICFFDSSLGLIYGLIDFSLAHGWMANIWGCIRGCINLLWLLGNSHFRRVYFWKISCISDCLVSSCI